MVLLMMASIGMIGDGFWWNVRGEKRDLHDMMIALLAEKPWIIIVVLWVAFCVSMIRLRFVEKRKRTAFQKIRSIEHAEGVSKLYLEVEDACGQFIQVKLRDAETDKDFPVLLNNKILTPAILLPEGKFLLDFQVKIRDDVTGWAKKLERKNCPVEVYLGRDFKLVFNAQTQQVYQEELPLAQKES